MPLFFAKPLSRNVRCRGSRSVAKRFSAPHGAECFSALRTISYWLFGVSDCKHSNFYRTKGILLQRRRAAFRKELALFNGKVQVVFITETLCTNGKNGKVHFPAWFDVHIRYCSCLS